LTRFRNILSDNFWFQQALVAIKRSQNKLSRDSFRDTASFAMKSAFV
jgi:hypothetical protein